MSHQNTIPDALEPSRQGERIKCGKALASVRRELYKSIVAFPPMQSPHEAYAIVKEELDELWEIVRQKNQQRDGSGGQDKAAMRHEAMQVAAMAIRFMVDLT
jgi:hypothetical protein